jgi:glycerol kinase
MKPMILAIDQGTTGSTAAFFDFDTLALLGNEKVEFPQHYPSPGLVEHDPESIWQSVLTAIQKAWEVTSSAHMGRMLNRIAAIGITNQRETVVGWNRKTGETVGNAIVWQDRRTADFCLTLRSKTDIAASVQRKTGLVMDPYFSATKMRWLLKNNAKAAAWAASGELCLGTIDSWIIYKLSNHKEFVTEHTNACRTMLYDLETGAFDSELASLFEVPLNCLPTINSSSDLFAKTSQVPGLPDGIPIMGCVGDQQAALFGQRCVRRGEGKITYGTGAFLLMHTGSFPVFSDKGLLTSVAYSEGNTRTFCLEGAAFIAGAAVQFLRDNFGWISSSAEAEPLANSMPRDENILFVPALTGLSAPYWNPHAKGVLFGLTRGTQIPQIIRAVLESVALQNVQLLRLMEESAGTKLQKVGVDGGASRNNLLMQFQADILRCRLARPDTVEITAKGAAMAAKAGYVKGNPQDTSESQQESIFEFHTRMNEQEAKKIFNRWILAAESVNEFYKKLTHQ